MIAATRFTTDSAASDSNPTEPVSRHAAVFSAIVATAAATDSQSSRISRWSRAEGEATELTNSVWRTRARGRAAVVPGLAVRPRRRVRRGGAAATARRVGVGFGLVLDLGCGLRLVLHLGGVLRVG